MNYYNEHDPKAGDWLRELIRQQLIPQGEVDSRSIRDVQPADLRGFAQCHFFAGIAGWSLALQLAGWPPERRVWTGSCPCQPFSSAGKQLAQADERHLWPDFFRLIRECRPDVVFGEQVASAIGHGWLDGICADLEAEGYACGHVVLGAHSVGEKGHPLVSEAEARLAQLTEWLEWAVVRRPDLAPLLEQAVGELREARGELSGLVVGPPHQRQRLYWVADAERVERHGIGGARERGRQSPDGGGVGCGPVADASSHGGSEHEHEPGRELRWTPGPHDSTERGATGVVEHPPGDGREPRRAEPSGRSVVGGCGSGSANPERMGEPIRSGLEGHAGHGHHGHESGRIGALSAGSAPATSSPGDAIDAAWSDFDLLPCLDGKARRVESGTFPLAHGVPSRVVRLRGYGNAIVPQVAAAFIQAWQEHHAENLKSGIGNLKS